MTARRIEEHPGPGRLGRHVEFDERSRAFRALAAPPQPPVTRSWTRRVYPFDQGDVGSCTGNAAAGLLVTAPNRHAGERIDEHTALDVYSEATRLDAFPGDYPPDDTGSTVLAALKAVVAHGYASAYRWAFGFAEVLDVLSHVGPVAVGVSWYEGFDHPDETGRVNIAGDVRGGHAFELLGVDTARQVVTAVNSWGRGWGRRGRFVISWVDLERLLGEDGEAVTVVR